MAKGSTPASQPELPKEVMTKLDPKLAELYSQLSSALASRISALVREALPQRIHPDRVLKFAYLYATAQRLAQGDSVSKEHTRRSKLELAGEIHGMRTGYRDDEKARQLYRRGRMARQRIKASLESVLRKWRMFEQVVHKHRSAMPVHLRPRFSKAILLDVRKKMHNMGIATVLDEEDLSLEQDREGVSPIAQTYTWWRLKLAPYRGKWNDMHQLAFAWHMSPAASVRSFRTVVDRACKGAECSYRFPSPWESVLSGK